MGTISSWGEAFMTSMSSALMVFMAAIPKIIAFALILFVGWFIAGLIAKGVAMLLRKVNFNQLADRAGISGFMKPTGTDAAGFLAAIVKWFVRLIAVVVAFDALGLPAVSEFLREVLLWIPNLVVALVVLVIGGLAAKALSTFVRGAVAKAGIGSPNLLASIASVAVWAFSIIVAVNQLGVGATLVNTLFMATVGALALAIGLAFGLGGRETAGRMVQEWYSKAKSAAPQAEQALDAARQQAQQMKNQATREAEQMRAGRSAGYRGPERRHEAMPSFAGIERRTGLKGF
jgi:hypothetical protein